MVAAKERIGYLEAQFASPDDCNFHGLNRPLSSARLDLGLDFPKTIQYSNTIYGFFNPFSCLAENWAARAENSGTERNDMSIDTPDIRMIALDLDGTTLAPGGVLAERTRKALEAALKKGVEVVVATGRCYMSLPQDIFTVEGLRYVITSNGAKISDLSKGEFIYSDCMSADALHRVMDVLVENRDRYRYGTEVFIDGRAYLDRAVYEDVLSGNSLNRSVDYIRTTRNPVDDVIAFARAHADNVENISVVFADEAHRQAMKGPLSAVPGTTFTNSFSYNWELEGETTDKGNALRWLMERVGVTKEGLMACGDSPNDLAMLRLAALPVAIGNAEPEVKEEACFVAPANGEDGVAVAIERYVLRQ